MVQKKPGIKEGDTLRFYEEDGMVFVKKMK